MKKKISLAVILCFLLFGYAQKAKCQNGQETNGHKPNIIFILTDDQRFSAMGYAGNKIVQTPEMDNLAENGTYFKNGMVTTPICSASRSSIFTGLCERTHRYSFTTGNIRSEYMANSYPLVLKKAGYYTGFFGKFGVKLPEAKKKKLFDVIEDYDRSGYPDYRSYYYKTLDGDTVHLTRYTGQKGLDFIDNAPKNKPFFLSLCFSAPHAQDNAPLQYFWQKEPGKLYVNKDLPVAKFTDDKYYYSLPEIVRNGFNRLRWHWRYDTPEKYQHSVKGYYRMINGIDLEIGKIRNELKKKGLDKNTVIILMGDNGQILGERQLAGKWLMYDNCVRVPFIIYDPRVHNHQDISDMALNIDVPCTIVDLAGMKQPKTWHGESLEPLVLGKVSSLKRDTILIEHLWETSNIPPSEGVRTSSWKYLRYINNKSIEELYNLDKDPNELNDLSKKTKYQDKLIEFRNKCDELGYKYTDPYSGTPYNLMVEYIKEPEKTVIKDSKPEFSWVIPECAGYQKAYQILVSSGKKLLYDNIGDVWNSGQIRSNKSADVEFKGDPLKPNTTYFWKVRIFDKDNRVSEYSKVQEFKTGSLDEDVTSSNSFQIEKIKPVNFKKNEDGSYFLDFGKDAFGTLVLNYKPVKEETLTIRLGEKLLNGKIDRNPGSTIRYDEVKLNVTPEESYYLIKLVPNKRNTNKLAVKLPESFPVIMPFRYAEIEGAGSILKPEEIIQQAYFSYFDYTSSAFSSSNKILNQVWELCKYSMKATSFSGYYIDGDRERIPYEADAYLAQLSSYSVDNEYTIARKTIEYFFESKPTWPTEWQLHVAMMMYQDYMYTGNDELIKKYYERLKVKTLMDLEVEDGFISIQSPKNTDDFLLKLGFPDATEKLKDIVDWPPASFGGKKGFNKGERDGYVFKRINTVVNAFYYHDMKIMAKFATLLNKPEEALDFEFRADRVKKSINEQLYNKDKGCYVDGVGTDHASLHANMFLLAFDVVPESRKQSVVNFVKSRGMACSVYGAQYLLEALYNAGEDDYALKLMSATDDRSWYNMIKIGSTITLEAWDMKYKTNTDWNHAWGAAPANIIAREMWGIQPKTPGYGVVKIKPQMGNLKNCSIIVPTIKGQIKCEYRKAGKGGNFSIEMPGNTTGEFIYDFITNDVVTLNGETVDPMSGFLRLNSGINKISIL